jgi:adenosine deaminase
VTISTEHIRALPKVELHVHVEGAAPALTVAEIAARNAVDLGVSDPAQLYQFVDLADFLRVYGIICRSLQRAEDLHRVTYEALQIAAAAGVCYREMFFSPTFLLRNGVPFSDLWAGIAAGIRDASVDLGIVCRMILDVDKPSGARAALELIEMAAAECDRDLLIGVGGDAGESNVDLAAFTPTFARARQLGLRTTMHLSEEGPVDDISVGVDQIGVERIDHGFHVLDDPALVARIIDRGIALTVCPTSNVRIGLVDSIAAHPVMAMRDAGLLVTLNSDNAAMFDVDLADEYCGVHDAFGCSIEELENFSFAGIDACWADEPTKAQMRVSFRGTMDELRAIHAIPKRGLDG